MSLRELLSSFKDKSEYLTNLKDLGTHLGSIITQLLIIIGQVCDPFDVTNYISHYSTCQTLNSII